MNRDLQTQHGEPYSRPFVPVGATAGLDEWILEVISAGDEGRSRREI